MSDPLATVDAEGLRAGWGLKWGGLEAPVLPAWIAESDVEVAPAIREALDRMLRAGELTYPPDEAPRQLAEAFAAHVEARHGWRIELDDVVAFTDVVQPVSFAIDRLSRPAEPVMIHTPCYGALEEEIRALGRTTWPLPWHRSPLGWSTRIDDVVAGADAGARLLLLVNPHNPTGRVWSRSELEELAAVVDERDLIVVADEMFADLTLDGRAHVPFASLSDDIAARTVTVTSAAKSHNLGGVRCAVAHLGPGSALDPMRQVSPAQIGQVSNLGFVATTAAWRHGDEWLDAFRASVTERRDRALAFLGAQLPELDVVAPGAGFMLWLDLRPLALGDRPGDFVTERALVRVADGTSFGPGGEGFVRLTISTSTAILDEMLERLVVAVDLWRAER